MPELYIARFNARWADMDFNQHLRNAAFLGYAEDTRIQFMTAHGFPAHELTRLQMGPVVLEDRLQYKRELKLLEAFRVDLAVAAITDDGRRMKVRNRFFREADEVLCATVESVVLWFDLAARAPTPPPEALARLWLEAARTDDFTRMG
jgi:acyl-CoA thioester hydrolase